MGNPHKKDPEGDPSLENCPYECMNIDMPR